MKLFRPHAAFTIVELMVVVAIMATASVMTFIGFDSYRNTVRVDQSIEQVKIMLKNEQSRMLNDQITDAHIVFDTDSPYLLIFEQMGDFPAELELVKTTSTHIHILCRTHNTRTKIIAGTSEDSFHNGKIIIQDTELVFPLPENNDHLTIQAFHPEKTPQTGNALIVNKIIDTVSLGTISLSDSSTFKKASVYFVPPSGLLRIQVRNTDADSQWTDTASLHFSSNDYENVLDL